MKPTFIQDGPRPLLVCLMEDMQSPADITATMRNAMYDGADAFAIHLDRLNNKHYNTDDFKNIFNYAADKPIMTIIHRRAYVEDFTDDEIADVHLCALEAGATMCDILGDMYESAPMELSVNPKIIDRQKKLVAKIHEKGGEVLMSSHTWVFMTAEETVEHAKALEARGADMIKIAMCAHSEREMDEVYKTTIMMKQELNVPFLHVCMGQYGKMHRAIAPILGSALTLCVERYTAGTHKEQVLLRATKKAYDNLDWSLARNKKVWTPFSEIN